jgi:putrescine transport system substrate-binding protein
MVGNIRIFSACLVMVIGLAGCGRHQESLGLTANTAKANKNVVNVYNWTDYIAPEALALFESETGIKVNYDVFDSNEVLETKLLTGHTGYDVVVPTDYFLERQARAGVLMPLRQELLPNIKNLDPKILSQLEVLDPGNRYGVPYTSVITGIGYNVEKLRAALGDIPIDSWAILFDPKNAAKLKACGMTLLDQQAEVIFSAKIWLGMDSASEDLQDLARIEQMLAAMRPFVRYFHSSQYINDLANGETCIALSWSGDILQARDRAREAGKGIEISFSVPKEGALRSFDMLAIPVDAPHAENAHRFINFLLRADVAAGFTEFRKYPTGNLASEALVPPGLRADPIIYPPAEVVGRLLPHRAESLAYARHANRTWTRVRTGL